MARTTRWNKRRRLLLRWTIVSGVLTTAAVVWAFAVRRPAEEAVLPGDQVDGLTNILGEGDRSDVSPIRFRDVTVESGIDFRHFPARRASLLPEDMGSGVACGDYDDDGYPDLYFVNIAGNILPGAEIDASRGRSRLYHNVEGRYFEDVTDQAGVGFVGAGMGAAWGDYDNDGDLDLYVTAYGDNVLYENMDGRTFRNVTGQAGVQDSRFSTGCSWADYDRDGDLDLYVCNYVDFVFRQRDRGVVNRQYATEQPYTLNPSAYRAQANSLFRNNGDGTFTDVADAAGVHNPEGRSLSASWADFNNDGWQDLYVANDVSSNGVFRNNGDGTFTDVGAPSLAADYRGAMGIAIGDFDGDLDEDMIVTHWIAQENALFRNMAIDPATGGSRDGRLWFMDQADTYGLGQISLDMVGWATGFVDFDNDGYRDLWILNGSTLEKAENHALLESQRPFLFRLNADRRFVEVGASAAPIMSRPIVARGGAQLDFNADGLVDLAWLIHGGNAVVLENVTHSASHWLRVELRQTGGNTRALGARVYVTSGGHTQMITVGVGSSYLSQNESTLQFGLDDVNHIDELRIVWPDGQEDIHRSVGIDRQLRFEHMARYPVSNNAPRLTAQG